MRLLATLVTAAAVLAGCVSGSPPTARPAATSPDPETPAATPPESPGAANATAGQPRVVAQSVNGTLTGAGASTDVVCCPGVRLVKENADLSFVVKENATKVVVTLTWSDASQDLDVFLMGADYKQYDVPQVGVGTIRGSEGHFWSAHGGTPGAGDSPVTITVTDLKDPKLVGAWTASARAKDAVNAAFTLKTEAWYGAGPAVSASSPAR